MPLKGATEFDAILSILFGSQCNNIHTHHSQTSQKHISAGTPRGILSLKALGAEYILTKRNSSHSVVASSVSVRQPNKENMVGGQRSKKAACVALVYFTSGLARFSIFVLTRLSNL